MLKGATILHSLFIWWINFFLTCVNELIWMCKHQEKVRSNQASISINSCTELSKTQLFPVIISLRKKLFFLFILCFRLVIFRLSEKTVSRKMKNGSYFPNYDTLIRTLLIKRQFKIFQEGFKFVIGLIWRSIKTD